MIIYSHTLTPRLQYVVDFLSQYFNVPIKIICDDAKYKAANEPHKINYSYQRLLKDEVWIHSHVLLFETAIRQVKIECFEQSSIAHDSQDYKAFFKVDGDFGFDPFAGIFYLLTRYEEYLPNKKDSYGRYAHENSLAFKESFLHLPLINIWLHDFKTLLEQKFSGIKLTPPKFHFQPTYDIDSAWSFKNKGTKRNAGAITKLFISGKWRGMADRIRVLRGKKNDPYDAYQWMDELHQQFDLHPIYFFLVAIQKGKVDKNIDVNNPEFRHLVQHLASKYKFGLHPSWASSDHPTFLPKEKSVLEEISGHAVFCSRQHFIRFDLPTTYRRLVTIGITDDFSMGYGSINGFRASIATPFYWYDLKNDFATSLVLHPFCFMEATSYYEQSYNAEEAFREMMQYYKVTKSYNGTMITIWHNSFLGTDPMFDGWREIYQKFISAMKGK